MSNKNPKTILGFLFFKTLNHSQPDFSGNPFFAAGKASAKKDWERKAEKLPK